MLGVDSRPITPESPLASSLDNITNTIDDLTLALNNFSRVPSPEPPSLFTCCCQKEDCENYKAWQEVKSRLESRLILSAEIGQALLQRHEAYVRRHENCTVNEEQPGAVEDFDTRLSDMLREKQALEKRLTQALVNNEVTEVSSKTLHQELQEARTTISRLSASHAKSIGWESRLSAAAKEKDDMQQERDFESQRARLAESRFAALKEKTSKLQSEVRVLQRELEQKRSERMESSDTILQDARTRIQKIHASVGSSSMLADNSELTNVLESLVDDNEGLKRDNAELQTLLSESRDDILALQQEVDEQRASLTINPPRSRAGTPLVSHFGRQQHHYSGSMPSSVIKEHIAPLLSRRNSSLERRGLRPPEPLTPDTFNRELPPVSPAESDRRSPYSASRFYAPVAPVPTSPFQITFDEDENAGPSSPEKARTHKPLFLLTRSRAVQTDPTDSNSALLSPSPVPTSPSPSMPIPSPSPHDPRSESSSFSESTASNVAILVERVTALLTRMTQADALTLTNRLKRQHLRGADVRHLSRTTVSNIINDISALRTQFRHVLEDENVVTMCTRKDLRAMFKLFREFFVEMGAMRITLNDVILDPSVAPKVSELALDPAKAEADKAKDGTGAGGWMAPISKLFSAPAPGRTDAAVGDRATSPAAAALGGLARSTSAWAPARPPRFVPKLGPALSASATTVNVEFSAGVGRSVTSSSAAPGPSAQSTIRATESRPPMVGASSGSSSVMGIFAGAPTQTPSDPWVVVPKGPRRVQSTLHPSEAPSPFRREGFGIGPNPNRLSRNVDAVIDEQNARPSLVDGVNCGLDEDEAEDSVSPLMQRGLRRRGLSDSSIHSTFMSQTEDSTSSDANVPSEPAWPTKGSVLQALSRKVQNFKNNASASTPSSYDDRRGPSGIGAGRQRQASKSGLSGFIQDISSWAALDDVDSNLLPDPPMSVGSPRDESSLLRRRDGMEGGRRRYGQDYY